MSQGTKQQQPHGRRRRHSPAMIVAPHQLRAPQRILFSSQRMEADHRPQSTRQTRTTSEQTWRGTGSVPQGSGARRAPGTARCPGKSTLLPRTHASATA